MDGMASGAAAGFARAALLVVADEAVKHVEQPWQIGRSTASGR